MNEPKPSGSETRWKLNRACCYLGTAFFGSLFAYGVAFPGGVVRFKDDPVCALCFYPFAGVATLILGVISVREFRTARKFRVAPAAAHNYDCPLCPGGVAMLGPIAGAGEGRIRIQIFEPPGMHLLCIVRERAGRELSRTSLTSGRWWEVSEHETNHCEVLVPEWAWPVSLSIVRERKSDKVVVLRISLQVHSIGDAPTLPEAFHPSGEVNI